MFDMVSASILASFFAVAYASKEINLHYIRIVNLVIRREVMIGGDV